ncbi:PP2C family serine/threonine-protein phosphatase [Thermophilibacter provencensis]|uniref:PP2C family serine/threonine-protein phosphatase n=1 Tax=Thermophilibacter provencensis TaxID=1852386 RepID=UPI00338EE94D
MKRVVWKRCGYARRGRSHLADHVVCQDSVGTSYRRNVSVVALSDGAGSAELSYVGSKVCASVLCDVFCRSFDVIWRMPEEAARASIVRAIRKALMEKLPSGYEMSSLASTALVVAVKRNRYIAAHLGDGVIGMRGRDSSGDFLRALSGPDNGEYSNETIFITSSDAVSRLRLYRGLVQDGGSRATGFLLMSDGPEAALYRKQDGQLAPACSKLLDAVSCSTKGEANSLLSETLELIASTKTFDDCSIALMSHV